MGAPAPGDSALAFVVPSGPRRQIDRWRRAYDRYYGLIPPHITIAYPPFVPEKEWPGLRPALQEVLAAFRPFDVVVRELGAFPGDPSVLWLKPEDGENLERIHAELLERFASRVSASTLEYVPHLTIGFFDSPDALSRARQSVELTLKPMQFTLRRLAYAVLGESNAWRLCDQLALGVRTRRMME
jgi:2'-5' RNA ligase